MAVRRVALIGHSGVGKSTALVTLGIDRAIADMDCLEWAKSTAPTIDAALAWLNAADANPSVVVVCNHEAMLKEFVRARRSQQYADRFEAIRFVYLCKPLTELRTQLERPTAGGRVRRLDANKYTLQQYVPLHMLYQSIADQTIHCPGMSAEAVAEKVRRLADELITSATAP